MSGLSLTYVPISASEHVYLNGQEVRRSEWTWNAAYNFIDLGSAGASGDRMECRYAHHGVLPPSTVVPPGSNDLRVNAVQLVPGVALTSTTHYSTQAYHYNVAGYTIDANVWFYFTAPATASYTFTVHRLVPPTGTVSPTLMGIRTVGRADGADANVAHASGTPNCSSTLSMTAGLRYDIEVGHYENDNDSAFYDFTIGVT